MLAASVSVDEAAHRRALTFGDVVAYGGHAAYTAFMPDVNPALRAELLTAESAIYPQIRGLHDLATVSISPALLAEIESQIVVRERRRDLIQAVLDQLDAVNRATDALAADGYPDLPKAELPTKLFGELHDEETDLDAAVAIFDEVSPATKVAVDLGVPKSKM